MRWGKMDLGVQSGHCSGYGEGRGGGGADDLLLLGNLICSQHGLDQKTLRFYQSGVF